MTVCLCASCCASDGRLLRQLVCLGVHSLKKRGEGEGGGEREGGGESEIVMERERERD